MAAIASKRKLNTKSIKDKYQALKEVEEGKSKLQVAAKYGLPKKHAIHLDKKQEIKYSKRLRKK